jgi:hypothetical protein
VNKKRHNTDAVFRRSVLQVTGFISLLTLLYTVMSVERLFSRNPDRNYYLRNFFTQQAKSMLNGQLDVDVNSLYGECFKVEDNCYGYFGVGPSVLRLPFLLFNETSGFTSVMVIVSTFMGLVFALLILNELWNYFEIDNLTAKGISSKYVRAVFVALAVSVGPGNLLMQGAFPSGYWEAIAWGTGFTFSGLYFLIKYLFSNKRYFIWLAIASFTLGANSRPNVAIVSFAVGFTLLFLKKKQKLYSVENGKYLDYFMLALTPASTMFAIFWLKFKMFIPDLTLNIQVPENSNWAEIYRINGGKSSGIEFIPSNFLAYFRPDSISFTGWVPELLRPTIYPFHYVWPLSEGGMYVETSASVTALAPFAMILTIVLVNSAIRKAQPIALSFNNNLKKKVTLKPPLNWLFLTASVGVIVPLTFVGNSHRYLVDFAPGVTLGSILGARYILKRQYSGIEKLLILTLSFIAFLGTVVNVLVAINQKNLWTI